MSFKIVVDSAANIPAVVTKKYDIDVLSFVNYVDGEEVVCFNPDATPEEELKASKTYYDAVRNGAKVKTSLVNSTVFQEYFQECAKQNENCLCIVLAANISGTFQAANIAREDVLEEYPECKIEVVNAKNASLGEGLLALLGSDMRREGLDVTIVAEKIREEVERMNSIFTVGDLKYLAQTGRIKGTTALVGNLLSVKPILVASQDGYIVQHSKIRGRKKALDTVAQMVASRIVDPENQIVGIAHADALKDAEYVADKISAKVNIKEFLYTCYDYCTGSHVGPDTVAVFFLGTDRHYEGLKE